MERDAARVARVFARAPWAVMGLRDVARAALMSRWRAQRALRLLVRRGWVRPLGGGVFGWVAA